MNKNNSRYYWQPIATAPKDGTLVHLYFNNVIIIYNAKWLTP